MPDVIDVHNELKENDQIQIQFESIHHHHPSPPLRPSLRLIVLGTPRRSPAERPKFFSFLGVSLPLEVEKEALPRCASYSSTTPPFILSMLYP